jgi:subtilisin family serine protease
VLQRKSGVFDPENRVIVAFRTAIENENPMESLKKGAHHLLEAEEYRMALGSLVAAEIQTENAALEEMLLEIVEDKQIVRRLPIGNTFVLENLTVEQAKQISAMERTVLLALSRFRATNNAVETGEAAFVEPVDDVKSWTDLTKCDPLHKSTCEPEIPWNIRRINTHESWKRGYKGRGIIYGVIDTGVSYKHPFMASNYFGRKENGVIDHNYAWFDGVQSRPKVLSEEEEEEESTSDDEEDDEIDVLEKEIDRKLSREHEEVAFEQENVNVSYPLEESEDYDEVDAEDELLKRVKVNFNERDGMDGDRMERDFTIPEEDNLNDRVIETEFEGQMEKNRPVLERCNAGSREPCDDAGHGTHVTSTAVGGYNFGVAPEARWMACRAFSGSTGRDEDALACLNFFLAPHDLSGKNPRPGVRPHVIGNSYGWSSWAEVVGAGVDLAVKRLEAAGTIMVFAAGNTGPRCSSIHSAFSFTVGATTSEGTLASFSSRGPWSISAAWASRPPTTPRSLLIKPDISAPGQGIHGAYGPLHAARLSGTSMAAPHVAGAVVLLRKQFIFVYNSY